MSLIIGVRYKNGCLVIADRRTHIIENGVQSYQDDYCKIITVNNRIVYNHGYNRIDDNDWKLRAEDLTPDIENPIYPIILNEMQTKPYQKAFFVFMSMTELCEISIIVPQGISITNYMPDYWLVSGSGGKYVDKKQLNNVQRMKYENVRKVLRQVFTLANLRQKYNGGIEFSEQYDIMILK